MEENKGGKGKVRGKPTGKLFGQFKVCSFSPWPPGGVRTSHRAQVRSSFSAHRPLAMVKSGPHAQWGRKVVAPQSRSRYGMLGISKVMQRLN